MRAINFLFSPPNDQETRREAFIKSTSREKMSISDSDSSKLTLEKIKDFVGEERLKRILTKTEMPKNLKNIEKNPSILTEEIIQKIFWAMGDVSIQDLEEKCLQSREFIQDLSNARLNEIYLSLVPFYAPSMDYNGLSPIKQFDKCSTSGKGMDGLKERVWTLVGMAKDSMTAENLCEEEDKLRLRLRELETLTSRLADRELAENTLLCLSEGLFVVDKNFIGGGAFVSILRKINDSAAIIVCRGTAFRKGATGGFSSAFNDIQPEIGLMGVTQIWPALSTYLSEKKYETIDICGKSLGGGHAQYLTSLIGQFTNIKIRDLWTLGSVGVPESVHRLFTKAFENKIEPCINRVQNWGKDGIDYIPELGGRHLSSKTHKSTMYRLIPAESDSTHDDQSMPLHSSSWTLAQNILGSLSSSHCRQTTMGDFRIHRFEIEGEDPSHDPTNLLAESFRTRIANSIHWLTRGCWSPQTFEQFCADLECDLESVD